MVGNFMRTISLHVPFEQYSHENNNVYLVVCLESQVFPIYDVLYKSKFSYICLFNFALCHMIIT